MTRKDPRPPACHCSVSPGRLASSRRRGLLRLRTPSLLPTSGAGFPRSPPTPHLPRSAKVKGNGTPTPPARDSVCSQQRPGPGDARLGPAPFPPSRGPRGRPAAGPPLRTRTSWRTRQERGRAEAGRRRATPPGAGPVGAPLTCAVRWSLPGPRRPQARSHLGPRPAPSAQAHAARADPPGACQYGGAVTATPAGRGALDDRLVEAEVWGGGARSPIPGRLSWAASSRRTWFESRGSFSGVAKASDAFVNYRRCLQKTVSEFRTSGLNPV